MAAELSMFAYPWDVAETGASELVAELASLGVDRINLATCYHSAEVIVPARRRRVAVTAEANVAHLPLPADAFSDIRPPAGMLATERPTLFADVRTAAAAAGLRLTGWTIALHNSSLAGQHPELAIRNCFGDAFAHGLCPASRRTQQYVLELTDALIGTRLFDELMLESLSYLLWGHGHPHELWSVRLDPTTRYLLSLCFCDACRAAATTRGLDPEHVANVVADELHRTWNHPLAAVRADDDGTELASTLALHPELWEWTRMRCEIVGDLSEEVAQRVHDAGMRLMLSAAIFGRPVSLNWTEGVDLGRLATIADAVMLESYYPELSQVARELDHALSLASADRLAMAQTLWPEHHGSLDGLLAKVDVALRSGVRSIALYNYSMAPRSLQGWIVRTADLIHGGGS